MNQILKKNYHYLLLFVITIILFSYIIGTNNIVGADTRFYFANIEAYLIKIVSLNTTPKLLPIIGNNYLYGTPVFYGSFPHLLTAILASIFYLFHVSYPILLAMKIFYILVFYLSSLIMYNWIKSVSKDKIVSLIGAVFYLTLPFKLWDVYIRDGYTEIFTFLFIPMVFYGLHLLLDKNDKNKFYIYFVIGFSGLLLSHLITTFFVIIATLIYLFIEYKKVLNKKVFITLVKSSIVIIGITAIYWIPFIQHYILGNYRIFNDTGLNLKTMFLNSTITLKQLFLINKIPGGKQFFIPIVIVLSFFYVIINYRRIETGKKNVFIAIIICLVFICFVTIKPLLYLIPKQLYSIQYLFRALIVPLCFLCFSSSFVFLFITGNKKIF